MALDYAGIQAALVSRLSAIDFSSLFTAANRINEVRVYEEANDVEQTLAHMPFINVCLANTKLAVTSISDHYYEHITFDVHIVTFDLSSFKDAARLRDGLLRLVMNNLIGARAFHQDLESSRIGDEINFGVATPQGAGGHVALATLKVVCEGYSEPA
jgi:hypothetical protein